MPSVENPLIQIPVSGETVEVEYVEGFEKKLYDMMPSAYIVALRIDAPPIKISL